MTLANELFYLGNFSEAVIEDEVKFIKEAELFSVGTHRGQPYTIEDLNALVENFEVDEDVPLQYDHSSSARDTLGFLRSVRVEGDKLLGTIEVLEDAAINRVKQGLNKKLSISFYTKKTEEGIKPFKLREVSLVAFPQVKSARMFSEDGSNYVSTFEPLEFDKEEGNKMDVEKMKEELRVELAAQYADDFAELEELRTQSISFNEMQIDLKIENFAQESKIIPAQKDNLKELLKSFSEEQMEQFENFMKSQVKVDLDENGEIDEEFGEKHVDAKDKEVTEFDEYYDAQAKRFGSGL